MTLSPFLYFFLFVCCSTNYTYTVFSLHTHIMEVTPLWVGLRSAWGLSYRFLLSLLYVDKRRRVTGSHVRRGCSSKAQTAEGTHVRDLQSSKYEGHFFGFGIIPEPVVFFTQTHTWIKGQWNINERTRWNYWQSPQLKRQWGRVFEAEQRAQLPLMSAYLCLSLITFMPFDPLLPKSGRQGRVFVLRILVCLVVYA